MNFNKAETVLIPMTYNLFAQLCLLLRKHNIFLELFACKFFKAAVRLNDSFYQRILIYSTIFCSFGLLLEDLVSAKL